MSHRYESCRVQETPIKREATTRDTFGDFDSETEPDPMGNESQVNPWVRVEMEMWHNETYELLPPDRIEEYAEIIGGLLMAKSAANEALGVVYQWEQRRLEFFQGLAGGKA